MVRWLRRTAQIPAAVFESTTLAFPGFLAQKRHSFNVSLANGRQSAPRDQTLGIGGKASVIGNWATKGRRDPVAETQAEELEALMVLQEKVYLPAFVKRCAELGVQLSAEANLRSALDVAAILKISQDSSASTARQKAVEAFRKAAGAQTDTGQDRQAAVEAAVKSVAAEPVVRKALSLLVNAR